MTLVEQIGALRRTMHRLFVRRLARSTSRPALQLLALRAIARHEVRTQSELAERLLVDAPTVSRLVEKLVRDGLLLRQVGDDRRCVHLEVTEASGPEIAVVDRELSGLNQVLLDQLGAADLEHARGLLARMQAALSRCEDPSAHREGLDR